MRFNSLAQNVTSPRDGYYDSLKFVLITLVILGHTLEANLDNRVSLALYNTVYLFHMPLFIFVTGYFSKKHADSIKYRSLLLMFETLVVFQTFHDIRMGNMVGGAALFLIPRWTMWYLYSVLAWKIFILITPNKLLKHPVLVLAFSVIVSLIVCYIKIDYLSFHRTCVFFPFFLIGYYCRFYAIDLKQQIKKVPPIVSIAVLGITFILLYFLDIPLFQLVSGSKPYNFFGQSNIVSLALRCLHLLLAIMLSVGVMSLVKEVNNALVRRIGSDTLFFYMIHSFVVLLTRQIFIALGIQFNMISMLLLFLINFAIVYFLSIIPYSHFILTPISKILKKQL